MRVITITCLIYSPWPGRNNYILPRIWFCKAGRWTKENGRSFLSFPSLTTQWRIAGNCFRTPALPTESSPPQRERGGDGVICLCFRLSVPIGNSHCKGFSPFPHPQYTSVYVLAMTKQSVQRALANLREVVENLEGRRRRKKKAEVEEKDFSKVRARRKIQVLQYKIPNCSASRPSMFSPPPWAGCCTLRRS